MFVYADNAATACVSKTALDAMMPYLTDLYGNPSSLYSFGQKAAEALQVSRETIAKYLNADPKEITFTSGGLRGHPPRPAPGRRHPCRGCGERPAGRHLPRDDHVRQ